MSYREKGSLAHSLQVTQQQAAELRQELEKLQATQEELRRQHTQLEEEQEDTVQEGARTRRELERRWALFTFLPGSLQHSLGGDSMHAPWAF